MFKKSKFVYFKTFKYIGFNGVGSEKNIIIKFCFISLKNHQLFFFFKIFEKFNTLEIPLKKDQKIIIYHRIELFKVFMRFGKKVKHLKNKFPYII